MENKNDRSTLAEAPRSVGQRPFLFSALHSTAPKALRNSVLRLECKNKTKKGCSSQPILQLGCPYNTVQTSGMEWKSEVCWEPPRSFLSIDHQRCPFCWDAVRCPRWISHSAAWRWKPHPQPGAAGSEQALDPGRFLKHLHQPQTADPWVLIM